MLCCDATRCVRVHTRDRQHNKCSPTSRVCLATLAGSGITTTVIIVLAAVGFVVVVTVAAFIVKRQHGKGEASPAPKSAELVSVA